MLFVRADIITVSLFLCPHCPLPLAHSLALALALALVCSLSSTCSRSLVLFVFASLSLATMQTVLPSLPLLSTENPLLFFDSCSPSSLSLHLWLNLADRTSTKLNHKDQGGVEGRLKTSSRRETEDIERAKKALRKLAKLGKVAAIGRPDGSRRRLYTAISSTLRELQIHICELLSIHINSHACTHTSHTIVCLCVCARVCVSARARI